MTLTETMPHCDARILHGPKAGCVFCNEHKDWQELRVRWEINFTGEHNRDKIICPSEYRRDLETIERWPGNRALTYRPDESRWCTTESSHAEWPVEVLGESPARLSDYVPPDPVRREPYMVPRRNRMTGGIHFVEVAPGSNLDRSRR